MSIFSVLSTGDSIRKGISEIAKTQVGKLALSSGIGAVAGVATSDSQSATGIFSDALRGAGIGAAGLMAVAKAPGMIKSAGKFAVNAKGVRAAYQAGGMKAAASTLGSSPIGNVAKMGFSAAKTAGKMGIWAMEHPLATGAIATGIGAAAYGMNTGFGSGQNKSPTLSGARIATNFNQQANAATLLQSNTMSPMGGVQPAPQGLNRYRQAMQQSTMGLTQGLHRGRHG